MSGDDIRRMASAPDNQNAAPLLKVAFADEKTFDGSPAGKKLAKIRGTNDGWNGITNQELDVLTPSIKALSPFFDVLTEASRKPKLDFHRAWGSGPAMAIPEGAEMRSCVSPLLVRAKLDLRAGKSASALDSLDIAARLSALEGQEPLLLNLLIQASMRSQVLQVLTDVIKTNPLDDGIAVKSRQVLSDLGPLPNVLGAMGYEFLSGRIVLKMLADHSAEDLFGNDAGTEGMLRLARLGPVRTVYDLRFTQTYRKLYGDLSRFPRTIFTMRNAFRQAEQDLDSKTSRDWTYGFVGIMRPASSQFAGVIAESEARRNVLLSALDLLEGKRTAGKFPMALPAQSGHWIDPCTDRPLIYHPTTTGFLIYSVGRDGDDNGGKPRPKKYNGQDHYDLPFAFP